MCNGGHRSETLPTSLRLRQKFPMSVVAFREKAGRSQVVCFVFSLDKGFLSNRVCPDAILLRTLEERFWFARRQLGVLVAAGAATC